VDQVLKTTQDAILSATEMCMSARAEAAEIIAKARQVAAEITANAGIARTFGTSCIEPAFELTPPAMELNFYVPSDDDDCNTETE